MQTKTNLRGLKERIALHRLLGLSVGGLAVFCLGFVLVPYLAAEASAVNDVSLGANWQTISLTLDPDYDATSSALDPAAEQALSTHGDVNFGNITPTSKESGITNSSAGNVGTLKILKKTIQVDTTGNYYQVFLSMASENTHGDAITTNDLVNTTSSLVSIPAIGNDGTSAGTWSSPAYFSAQGWGYAVTGDSSAITLPSFFNIATSTLAPLLNQELTYANNENVYKNVKFASVPLAGSPQQIYKNTTNVVGGFDGVNADTFNIYYGVMVNTDVLAGTYENQIVYTALASASNLDEASENLAYAEYYIAEDSEQTISFDLASSAIPTNISTTSIKVYLIPHDDMLAAGTNGYDITELAGYANPSNSYSQCIVTTFSIDSHRATITCTSPASPNGVVDDTGTDTNGKFDYWLHIDGLNFDYISHTIDDTEAVAYVGLQSKRTVDDGEGGTTTEPYITEMQEMKGSICKNTNMWNNQTGDNTQIYDYRGHTTGTALLPAGTETEGISYFTLVDNRDNNLYTVRRYADGNCWMGENLKLQLSDFAFTNSLTAENTDLNSQDSWDPAKSMYELALSIDPEATESNYFEIVSLDRLGTTESYQFQPSTISGQDNPWGSHYYDDNGVKTYGDSIRSNEYSEMPRSYNKTSGTGQYNFYAFTAESGTFNMGSNSVATDSICPKGWRLPAPNKSIYPNKSWQTLFDTYNYNAGTSSTPVRSKPIYVSFDGFYDDSTGSYYYAGALYASPLVLRSGRITSRHVYGGGGGPNDTPMAYGLTVRCIARD